MNLMTPQETAVMLRISPNTLAKMRCRGDGPPYIKPTGRTVLYDKEDIHRWLDDRRRLSTSQLN